MLIHNQKIDVEIFGISYNALRCITNPIKKGNTSLTSFPDYSDEVMSDFRLAQMLGKPMEIPAVVDLDTADDYVNFIKNTIKNVIASENEFNISNSEISEKSKV